MRDRMIVFCRRGALLLVLAIFPGLLPPHNSRAQTDEASDAGAEIAFREWRCRIDGNEYEITHRERVVVRSRLGDRFGDLSFSEGRFSKLKAVKAALYDNSGNLLMSKEKGDFTKSCGFDAIALYADICHYHGDMRAEQYPYVLEIETVHKCQTLFLLHGATFQSSVPVRSAEYVLEAPSHFKFAYRESGLSSGVTVDTSGSDVVYRWKETDIPAYEDVDFIPPDFVEPVGLVFAPARFDLKGYKLTSCTWNDIGHWYQKLAEEKYGSQPGSALSPGVKLRHVADSLYRDLIGTTRYVAIEVGLGGWQPYSSEKTLSRGFGDCKDLSTALISKFWDAGISAYPALVRSRGNGRLYPDFPEVNFNHVITAAVVDGDTLWYDPTCSNCPPGVLPSADEDIDVLVVSDDGGRLWRTPMSTAKDNFTVRNTRLHITENGMLRVNARIAYAGNTALWVRGTLSGKDRDQRERWIGQRFDGGPKAYGIRSFTVDNLENLSEPPIVEIEAVKKKKLRKLKGRLYVPLLVMARLGRYEKTDLEGRAYPLNLFYPETETDTVVVTWHESINPTEFETEPPDSVQYLFGSMSFSVDRTPDSLVAVFRRTYDAYTVEPEQFDAFESFRDRLKAVLKGYVKLSLASGG